MSVVNLLTDSTTLILDGRVFNDLAEGDNITIAPVNPSTSRINSIGGGVNINARSDGGVHDVTIRVQLMSEDDVILNSWEKQRPAKIISGSAKQSYNRDGTDGVESWLLEGGSFTTKPTRTSNSTDGNAMMEYVIQFRTGSRNL